MKRLFLVRHAENPANVTKEFSYKKIDYSLNEKGKMQAEQTAEVFVKEPIASITSSPLKRAYETAKAIAQPLKMEVRVMEHFREVNVGDLEGVEDLQAGWKQHKKIVDRWFAGDPKARFPGGEDYLTLLERIVSGCRTVLETGGNGTHIIVAHGGVINLGLPGLCNGITLGEVEGKKIPNCGITEIHFADGIKGDLIRHAAHDHLHGEAANQVTPVPEWLSKL